MSLKTLLSFEWPTKFLLLRGILVVFGGFLVHLTLGTIYTFGNIAPYIVSYVRNQSHPTNLRQETTTWIFAFALVGQGGAMFLGGWMVKKIGPRWTTLLGGWIMSLGVGLSYLAIQVSYWLLLLTYGLLFGIGVGIGYIGPLSSAMKWMPKWKGLANGIVVAGFGLGALIFDAVQTLYINPENKKPKDTSDGEKIFTDAKLLHNVPFIFLILAGTYAVVQLVGSLLITDPPEGYLTIDPEDAVDPPNNSADGAYREIDDEGGRGDDVLTRKRKLNRKSPAINESPPEHKSRSNSPSNSPINNGKQLNGFDTSHGFDEGDEKMQLLHNEDRHQVSKQASPDRVSDLESSISSTTSWTRNIVTSLKPLQMLKKTNFYLLWFMFAANGVAVIFMATLYKFFGQDFIKDDHFFAIVGSVSAIFNSGGRIIWGIVADRVSYKFALVILTGSMSILSLTFYASVLGGKIMYFIWVCMIFFCVGGNFSLFPTAIGRAFGLQYVSVNYGLLFTSQIVAGTVGALLSSTLIKLIHYYGILFVVSAFSLFGFLLALLYKPKRYISLQLGQND